MESRSEIIGPGILAGLIGGVAMALFAMIYAAAAGLGFWEPVQAIGATVSRANMAEVGAGGILVGIVFHLLVSMFFGVIFAFVMPRTVPPAVALALGLFAGMSALVIMSLVIVPIENPSTRTSMIWGTAPGALPVWVAWVMHLLYGAGLSLVPGLKRRLGGRVRPIAPRPAT